MSVGSSAPAPWKRTPTASPFTDTEIRGSTVVEFERIPRGEPPVLTGPVNLTASLVCRGNAHINRYVTERLGVLPGIGDVEVTPALRVFKQSQTLVDARELAVQA